MVKPTTIDANKSASPAPTLSFIDAVAIIVGIVVGAGIFKTPSLVAANAGSELAVLLIWIAGGAVSLIGALCYAELVTTYPSAGGDYHYLTRAYGRPPAFLFAWSRITVIQTGSLALLAYAFGDYASQVFRLGEYSSAIYAALIVIGLTALNMIGIRHGTRTQNILTIVEVASLLVVIAVGLFYSSPAESTNLISAQAGNSSSVGLAMVFVLLTYGGWNEAAYVSAEIRGKRTNMAGALLLSIAIITGLYLLVNWAYLRGLGLSGMAQSETVAADLLKISIGERGAQLISLFVAVSALTSANATIITGARTNYALGRDFKLFGFLGQWDKRANTPTNALLVQGGITLMLVLLGALTRKGFSTMVEYTAPVFWLFFLLTGASLIVLRRKEPEVARPFSVPLYPILPVLFCLSCAYMLQASLSYTGIGAGVGVIVLLTGLPVYLFVRRQWTMTGPTADEAQH